MIISCSEHLRKIPFFTKSSFPIKLLTSQKKKLHPKKWTGKSNMLLLYKLQFFHEKVFVRKNHSLGKVFFPGNTFIVKILKEKLSLFPNKFFLIRYHFFYSALVQCINSSKANGNRPNLNQINQ